MVKNNLRFILTSPLQDKPWYDDILSNQIYTVGRSVQVLLIKEVYKLKHGKEIPSAT